MRSEGFTFVELIVVLAILAGLAALVAPSFSRTVASARLRTAASDVRSTFARARALAVASARERSAVLRPFAGRVRRRQRGGAAPAGVDPPRGRSSRGGPPGPGERPGPVLPRRRRRGGGDFRDGAGRRGVARDGGSAHGVVGGGNVTAPRRGERGSRFSR